MNSKKLFDFLQTQSKELLLKLLQLSYNNMNAVQTRDVFGDYEEGALSYSASNGDATMARIHQFKKHSLAGEYYAPFDINSKNFSKIPDETSQWFEDLASLLMECVILSRQKNYSNALSGFQELYELVGEMESGEEIIFADEYGMWMLPISEEPCIEAYIRSAAMTLKPQAYVDAVLAINQYDHWESNTNKVLEKAIKHANPQQRKCLKDVIK